MSNFNYSNNIIVDKTNQNGPYRLYKKTFKNRTDRQILDEFKSIVLKYHPNYTEKDIAKLYENLGKSGCTYASMANTIIHLLNFDNAFFRENFGFNLYESNGTINYDKVMLDIYTCLEQMVQLDTSFYRYLKGKDVIEIASTTLNHKFDDTSEAIVALFKAGWNADGKDEEGNLIFKSKNCINKTYLGSYTDIAKELFGLELPNLDKQGLISLLEQSKIGYHFSYEKAESKLSGLTDKAQNFWINKYFQAKNIDLTFEARLINTSDYSSYEDFMMDILNKRDNNSFISIATGPNSSVWMTDGSSLGWMKPSSDKAGHQMTFSGFDNDGNILVSTYGKLHMIPKNFYSELQYIEAKIDGYMVTSKKSHNNTK